MEFLEKSTTLDMFEVKIDLDFFSKDIVMETAYNFIDKWYFLFNKDKNSIIVKCRTKDINSIDTEKLLLDFTDELLNVYLRSKIDKQNWELRNSIINKSLNSALDVNNFVELNIDKADTVDDDIEKMLWDLEWDDDLLLEEKDIQKIIDDMKNK